LFRNYLFFFIILIKLITEQRYNFVADYCYKYIILTIYSCRACVSFNIFCCINREYLKYKKYYRKNRKCNLISNYQKIDKVIKKTEKLNNKITELRLRIARKTK